jgi:hypothetical protein
VGTEVSTAPLSHDEVVDELNKVARSADQRSKLGALRLLHEIGQMRIDGEEKTFVRVIIGTNDVATPPLPDDYDEREYMLAWVPVNDDD